ncbi:acriflavine resistance protein B [Erwinia endophytica]|uniref:efflux RND transporter permease subunit n=1 Tax=Erwinia endophytica TaxID=1563158 RepID=UPI001265F390|nr:efflux RND transporter permease subunit [Erwinia endophytica]KAB8312550.1 acriflavine resistance protein B [Erwinia endophytica]
MSLFEPFIRRHIGTSLVALGVMLIGAVAYFLLPVAPLPQVDFPTIQISASLPGASAETMATSVATPLEKALSAVPEVTSMTSASSLGVTSIAMQFDLSRDINAAAQDVQTALTSANGQLPKEMPNPPTFHKVNPAEATIISLALTSKTRPLPELDEYAEHYLGQQLSQMPGVGLVDFHGQQHPAVRIQIDPDALATRGLTLEDLRSVVGLSTLDAPKGNLSNTERTVTLNSTDQLLHAGQFEKLVVAYKNGTPIHLGDLGKVIDAAEDNKETARLQGQQTVIADVHKQAGFNVIDTVNAIKARLPQLRASLPADVQVTIVGDRTQTIEASIHDVQFTLLLSVALVVAVIFVFLRNFSATLIPTVTIPLSLLATFGVMYLLGYSLDNLSVMALSIAVGFVVDDAVVVMENIVRHTEMGKNVRQAALDGVSEVGSTIVSMTLSLITVFVPILLMGGIIGRLFREFAVTISIAVLMSGIVALTVTPMLSARILKSHSTEKHGRLYLFIENLFEQMLAGYRRSLDWVLSHQRLTLSVTVLTLVLTVLLYIWIPKGFFPAQDTGQITGVVEASPDISFDNMRGQVAQISRIVQADPAVDTVRYWIGANPTISQAHMIISLKPFSQRRDSATTVIARLRQQTHNIPGVALYMQAQQDIQIGARASKTQYQYTLEAADSTALSHWSGVLLAQLKKLPQLTDVTSDQQALATQMTLVIDREVASRLGVSVSDIDNVLYDAFGQRQVATLYTQLDQNHVILELNPHWQMNSDNLQHLYVRSSINNNLVPLSILGHLRPGLAPVTVNHQGPFPAVTLSFNLAAGQSLGNAVTAIQHAALQAGLPDSISATFQGTAQSFQSSLKSQPWLILSAIIAVYILLGVLYESAIHPLTIISTLPSAGIGALAALILCGQDLSIMGMIGILLLVGIVKKNAIMMVDFALSAERNEGLNPHQAIRQGCLLRFRPIMMTTMAALLGAIPLALGVGAGSELRQPLGIAIIGGLLLSQALTLYTTPVVYLWFSRWTNKPARAQKTVDPAPAKEYS